MEGTSVKKVSNFLKKLWKDESGQGATEYILLLVVIVGLVMVFGPQIKDMVSTKVGELGEMVRGIKP